MNDLEKMCRIAGVAYIVPTTPLVESLMEISEPVLSEAEFSEALTCFGQIINDNRAYLPEAVFNKMADAVQVGGASVKDGTVSTLGKLNTGDSSEISSKNNALMSGIAQVHALPGVTDALTHMSDAKATLQQTWDKYARSKAYTSISEDAVKAAIKANFDGKLNMLGTLIGKLTGKK